MVHLEAGLVREMRGKGKGPVKNTEPRRQRHRDEHIRRRLFAPNPGIV